jgi:hypothetical protein
VKFAKKINYFDVGFKTSFFFKKNWGRAGFCFNQKIVWAALPGKKANIACGTK